MPVKATSPVSSIAGSGRIVVCGMGLAIDHRVVSYIDDPTLSAYYPACYHGPKMGPPLGPHPFSPAKGMGQVTFRFRPRRTMGGLKEGPAALSRLQQLIRQFVVHHDGCNSSRECFHVLHDERGLSVHFLIDNDGTIYQTLDLADCAFQATGVNEFSIGVELCNRGDVALDGPNRYHDRNIKEIAVNGGLHKTWDYTEAQYQAMIALGKALARIFPALPQVYPDSGGDLLTRYLADPRGFSGYLGHYHVTNQKWDPGSFDFKRIVQKIRSRATWFVCLGKAECERGTEIEEDPKKLERQAQELVSNNEEEAMGGYCPVVPFGKSTRVWHGGIHLSLVEGAPLFSPFPGRIVACFFGDDAPIGSRNFVLVRHRFNLGGKPVAFHLLYMHLQMERPDDKRTPWFQGADKRPFWQQLQDEQVAFPDVDVAGGEVLGHVGQAGPPGNWEAQVHVEAFAAEEIGAKVEPGFWKVVEGGEGPYCNVPEIMRATDPARLPRGHWPSRGELESFLHDDDARAELRKLAVRFPSEWGALPDYPQRLEKSKEWNRLPPAAKARIFQQQIRPTQWLTPEVAQKLGLPKDYALWHYNPVRFVAWIAGQLAKQPQGAQVEAGKETGPMEQSLDPHAGEGFTDDGDELSIEAARRLTLEDLAKGYPE